MTQPAQAFAPGSPSGGGGIAQTALKGALGGALGGLFGGGGGGIPGLSLSSSSSATAGDAYQGSSTTGDGFTVNYGNGVSQGVAGAASASPWLWLGAALVGMWLWKHRSI